jgi:hypothetical protein
MPFIVIDNTGFPFLLDVIKLRSHPTNNPFVSIPLETVKGWLEAEPQK